MQSQPRSKWHASLIGAAVLAALLAAPRDVRAQSSCLGDCGDTGAVDINDLILGVNIALGLQPISACPAFDNGSGMVTIDVLITAVNNALAGCPPTPTATATNTGVAPTATATTTPSTTATRTVTATGVATATSTGSPVATATATNTAGPSGTATETPTVTPTPTATEVPFLSGPSKSSAIAVSEDEFLIALVNPDNGTLSVFAAGTNIKLSETAVGNQPVSVVIHPNSRTAYVANRADGTVVQVSEIDTPNPSVSDAISVGSEPTGLALSPSGNRLFVAEWAEGSVAVLDAVTGSILDRIEGIRNPRAVAVTNDGDEDDSDESLLVTEFYGAPNPDTSGCAADNPEVCDTGRIGRVLRYSLANLAPLGPIVFQPLDSGFAPSTDPPDAPTVMTAPNQLYSAAIQGGKVYVTSVSASPEPPVNFQANVFPVLYVADLATGMEDLSNVGTANLARLVYDQIPEEENRRFLQEIVDLAFDGDSNVAYVVSRAADTVQRLTYDPSEGIIVGTDDIKQINTAPDCQNPIGIAISPSRRRAYLNCWLSRSLGVINLDAQVLSESHPSAALPPPDSEAEAVRLGQRFYFTGRGRWSSQGNGFSSCGSCHPDGLSDGITWSFAAGPRQTTSMDGSFSKGPGPQRQRQFNWTGIFDEIHDFERNTRGVSGGLGAITVSDTDMCGNLSFEQPVPLPADGLGLPVKVVQDTTPGVCTTDWDKIEAFARTIRPPRALRGLDPAAVARGAALFVGDGACHTCHAGPGFTAARRFWTPSEINNDALMVTPFQPPTDDPFWSLNPFEISGEVVEEGDMPVAPNEITCGLRDVGTFGVPGGTTATEALERRANGAVAQGAGGFTIPSLYGLAVGAPYFHHGQAETLEDVLGDPLWEAHRTAGNPAFAPTNTQIDDLAAYLRSIDASADEPALREGFEGCPAEFPTFVATLSGAQEVPPVIGTANGSGVFQLNRDATELSYEVRFFGIDPATVTQAHLHVGPASFNGPIVLFLVDGPPASNILRGTLTADDLIPRNEVGVETFEEFVAALRAGDVYVNIHTMTHPAGAIRGQIAAPIPIVSTLTGDQEVPPVTTTASGTASFELSADRTRLLYRVEVNGIEPEQIQQAHLHVAPAGFNGPVVLFLVAGSPSSLPLTGELTAADLIPRPEVGVIDFDDFVRRLLDGDVYVNVHTMAHPSGEIRGQLAVPESFPASLDGAQEVPPVATTATGRALFTLNETGTELRFAITTSIPADQILQAHLHAAPRGFNGPVVLFLADSGFAMLRMGRLTAADLILNASAGIESFADFVDALRAGDIYANVHTIAHASGEIRGQLRVPTEFVADLDGQQEVPPVASDASGRSRIVLAPDEQSLRVVLATSLTEAEIVQAHIEIGIPGETGPVAFFLAESSFVSPRLVTLTPDDFLPSPVAPTYEDFLEALRSEMTYVNVRTVDHPDGEIRGQIQAPVTLSAMLDGAQEVPEVPTDASGRGQVVINAARDRMRFILVVENLPPDDAITQAHIHTAPVGVNGGIAFFLADGPFTNPRLCSLTPEDFLSTPETPTYAEFVEALLGGGTYMNVHTEDHMAGEVRGQLLP